MRDELGVTDTSAANPLQAALASAISFLTGGAAPLAAAVLFAESHFLIAIVLVTAFMLTVLGGLGAKAGGASLLPGISRMVVFGLLAMGVTALVGHLFHTTM